MKRTMIYMLALACIMSTNAMAQAPGDTFIKIEDDNMFSKCFELIDTNGDGIVTYAEAEAATALGLDRGGRLNIIDDYEFLKYFPNLEALSVGNTTLDEIDIHWLKKLKAVDVTNALWLKKIIVGGTVAPEITGENPTDLTREAVKVEFWVEDPVARDLLHNGYDYVEPVTQDGETFYIVSKEMGVYGLWHNGKLEVPCSYNYDVLKENYFTTTIKELPAPLQFKDEAFKDFCLRNKVDANKDKAISKEEAEATTKLSLMNFKSFMRVIKSYDDLKYFPNLEYFHAGMTYAETLDVSCCPKLKELDATDCRMLKTIVLAKGCKPEIKYPVAYKGEQVKLIYK